MTGCPHCTTAVRSAWETDPCPNATTRRLANDDLAVGVLEAADGPLTIYDIQRGIERDRGWAPQRASLNVSIANDPRCCWAGRGLYAMYRHGFIPGPRRLLDVARVVLASIDTPLHLSEIGHAMKDLGYRFQDQSVRAALVNASRYEVEAVGWMTFSVEREKIRSQRTTIRLAPTAAGADEILEDVVKRTTAALKRRREVLRRNQGGTSATDPILTDGSQAVERS